jgi:hypothetical protein
MSGRCCLGQDDGNGILRAANSGVAVTGITQRFSPAPLPGPARPKASDSLTKGRAERPDRRHLDLDRRRARPEADRRRCVRLVLVTGLCLATVRSAKLGVRTGWNAAAACLHAGLAGICGAMENSAALVTGASKGIGKEIARQLASAGFGLYTSRSGVLAWKSAVR